MRNFFLSLIIMLFAIAACKKKENVRADSINNVSSSIRIKNGHLVFNKSSDYESFVNKPLNQKKAIINSLSGQISFTSFRQTRQNGSLTNQSRTIQGCNVPDTLVEDNEDFFETLDDEGVVQVDSTIYRYDYCNDGVWVISETNAINATYYSSFMSGTEIVNKVGFFPNYVDVLDAVAAGYTTMPDTSQVSESEKDIFSTEPTPQALFGDPNGYEFFYRNINENVRLRGKIAYDVLGIWRHFYANEKYQEPCFLNWCTSGTSSFRDWYVNYNYKYVRRGSGSEYTGSGTLAPTNWKKNEVSKNIYSGFRKVKKYFCQWDVENVDCFYHVRIYRGSGIIYTNILLLNFNNTQIFDNHPYNAIEKTYKYFIYKRGY